MAVTTSGPCALSDIGRRYTFGLGYSTDGTTATMYGYIKSVGTQWEETTDIQDETHLTQVASPNSTDRFDRYPRVSQGDWTGGERQEFFVDPTRYYTSDGNLDVTKPGALQLAGSMQTVALPAGFTTVDLGVTTPSHIGNSVATTTDLLGHGASFNVARVINQVASGVLVTGSAANVVQAMCEANGGPFYAVLDGIYTTGGKVTNSVAVKAGPVYWGGKLWYIDTGTPPRLRSNDNVGNDVIALTLPSFEGVQPLDMVAGSDAVYYWSYTGRETFVYSWDGATSTLRARINGKVLAAAYARGNIYLLASLVQLSASPPQNVQQSFLFTGAAQSMIVPTGVTSITVDMTGGGGGAAATGAPGGKGARVRATYAVTPGQQLDVQVGGKGSDAAAGGGGVYGGATGGSGDFIAGAGGSGSRLAVHSGATLAVAGAGGGGGGENPVGTTCAGGNSAAAGSGPTAGQPGTNVAGGAAGLGTGGAANGTAGSSLTGGAGGFGNAATGGGGGGGFFGGGGAGGATTGATNYQAGGGGGGSSTTGSGTAVTVTQGYQASNGYITISWVSPAAGSASVNYTLYSLTGSTLTIIDDLRQALTDFQAPTNTNLSGVSMDSDETILYVAWPGSKYGIKGYFDSGSVFTAAPTPTQANTSPGGVAVMSNQTGLVVVSVSNAVTSLLQRSSTTPAASGTLTTSYFDFATPTTTKAFVSFEVELDSTPPVGSVISASYRLDSQTSYTAISQSYFMNPTSQVFLLPVGTKGSRIQFQVTLSPGSSQSPVVRSYSVNAVLGRVWKVTVDIPLAGMARDLTGEEDANQVSGTALLSNIENAYRVAGGHCVLFIPSPTVSGGAEQVNAHLIDYHKVLTHPGPAETGYAAVDASGSVELTFVEDV